VLAPGAQVTLVAVALAAQFLSAQEQEGDPTPAIERAIREHVLPEVTTRLRSDLPQTVAWGGYLAQRYRLSESAPQLRKVLAKWAADATEEGEYVRLSLLDALVQLEVAVPAAEIVPHLRGLHFNAAFVLLARDPKANERALLDVFRGRLADGHIDAPWIAAGHLLAKQKAQGLAALLLGRVHCGLRVIVRSPGEKNRWGTGVSGTVSFRCPRLERPRGFPPVPAYCLSTSLGPGALLLTDGDPPIGWTRTEYRGTFSNCSNSDVSVEALLWSWLDALCSGASRLHTHELEIQFTSADAFGRQVEAARVECEEWLADTVAELGKKKLLNEDDTKDLPRIELVIDDQRADKTEPLPEIAGTKGTRRD